MNCCFQGFAFGLDDSVWVGFFWVWVGRADTDSISFAYQNQASLNLMTTSPIHRKEEGEEGIHTQPWWWRGEKWVSVCNRNPLLKMWYKKFLLSNEICGKKKLISNFLLLAVEYLRVWYINSFWSSFQHTFKVWEFEFDNMLLPVACVFSIGCSTTSFSIQKRRPENRVTAIFYSFIFTGCLRVQSHFYLTNRIYRYLIYI